MGSVPQPHDMLTLTQCLRITGVINGGVAPCGSGITGSWDGLCVSRVVRCIHVRAALSPAPELLKSLRARFLACRTCEQSAVKILRLCG